MDFGNLIDNVKETVMSPLEKLVGTDSKGTENLESLNKPIDNPYSSGFDKDHPMPTYDDLRNAGFSDYLANQILYGTHSYSDKELFNVLYSPNPKEAYDNMMKEKVDKHLKECEELLDANRRDFGVR